MEFSRGHNSHHHHHHRRNDEQETPPFLEDNQFATPPQTRPSPGREFAEMSHVHHFPGSPNYPPPQFDPPPPPPPVVQVSHVHHTVGSLNYPPPQFDPPPPPPPVLQVSHVHHTGGSLNYPPPQFDPPPPPPPVVQVSHVDHTGGPLNYAAPRPAEVLHVDHEVRQEGVDHGDGHHHFKPHMPSFLHHHTQSQDLSELSRKPAVEVYCKANTSLILTIRDGKVILAPSDTSDGFQHWYKDEKYSTKVKDEEGYPCFALVNKVTGQAMKHSVGVTHPVQLVPYNPDVLDESVLWTEGKDLGDGYRAVRMVNNIHLNVDAFHGDKRSGGVHDGTIIVLGKWTKGDNQRWKIVPHLVRGILH